MPADTDKIRSIFLTAVEHYSAEQWPAYLDGACAGDLALRRRVEKLLEHLGHPISAEERAELIARTHREVDEQVLRAEATGQPDWRIVFEDVYADLPDHLRQQEAFLRAEQTGGQA